MSTTLFNSSVSYTHFNKSILSIFIVFISFCWSTEVFAQNNDTDRSNNLNQFDFIVGTWSIDMKMRNREGEFVDLPNKGFMEAFFHKDNKTLQTQFTAAEDFYSTDLRTYDELNGNWRVLFLNAGKQRWQEFQVQQIEGKMVTIIKNGYSGKEKFDVKTVQESVTKDQFISSVYYSFDQGETWQQVYLMTYNRKVEDHA